MRAVVFSGTSDGKRICEHLSKRRIITTACVATEFGQSVMDDMKYVSVRVGRMSAEEMTALVRDVDFVIDATHPYAAEATKNIRAACLAANREYIRLLRSEGSHEDMKAFNSAEKAAAYLSKTDGRIFLTTGSKELEAFLPVRERTAARVLDTPSVREKCDGLGFSEIIYKYPPFSYEDNIADFSGYDIIVTKDSGKEGGFDEKIRAARALGMEIVLISRPEDSGKTIDEVIRIIDEKAHMRFPLFADLYGKKVVVVGAGNIGKRRIATLADFGADVVAVDKENTLGELLRYVTFVQHEFEESDLDGAFLAVAATNSDEVNERIYKICKERGIWVSVASDRTLSDFYFPAICRNDKITAGVVSDGTDHSLVRTTAEKIRGILNENKGRQP